MMARFWSAAVALCLADFDEVEHGREALSLLQLSASSSQGNGAEQRVRGQSHLESASIADLVADQAAAEQAQREAEARAKAQAVARAQAEAQPAGSFGQALGDEITGELQSLVSGNSSHQVKLSSTVVVEAAENSTNATEGEPKRMKIARTLVIRQSEDATTPSPDELMPDEPEKIRVPDALVDDVNVLKERHESGNMSTFILEAEEQQFEAEPAISPEDEKERHSLAAMRLSAADMVAQLGMMLSDVELVRDIFAADSRVQVQQIIPPIGFIKTHRTGGSTITSILHRLGDTKDLRFLLPGSHLKGLGWPGAFPGRNVSHRDDARQNHDIICHDAVFSELGMRQYLRPSPFFFTALREPSEQIASAFEAFAPSCDNDWEERISWLRRLSHGEAKLNEHAATLRGQFLNPQAFDLGWYDHAGMGAEGGAPYADRDDGAVERWLASLDRSLGLVILTEYFNEGLLLLRRKLGLELREVQYLAMKRSTARSSPSPAQRERLRSFLPVDVKLYEHFNRTFWQEWEDAGGYPLLSDELEMLSLRNEALDDACQAKDSKVCTWIFHADGEEYTEYLRQKQAILDEQSHRSDRDAANIKRPL